MGNYFTSSEQAPENVEMNGEPPVPENPEVVEENVANVNVVVNNNQANEVNMNNEDEQPGTVANEMNGCKRKDTSTQTPSKRIKTMDGNGSKPETRKGWEESSVRPGKFVWPITDDEDEVNETEKEEVEVKDRENEEVEVKEGENDEVDVKDREKEEVEGENDEVDVKDREKEEVEGENDEVEVQDRENEEVEVKEGEKDELEVNDREKEEVEVKEGEKEDRKKDPASSSRSCHLIIY